MKLGIFCLVAAYGLSQFYRAFLAVLSPVLGQEIGATPEDLAQASGLWFLAFAAMQIPIGWALDTIGPRRTTTGLFVIGGAGGAALFAMAQTPLHVSLAMMLIGVGCAPVLMASYFIFARVYSPAVFATLAGAVIGFGTFGNIAGSVPLAWAAETFGWRETMFGLSGLTLLVALAIFFWVQDPPKAESGEKGSLMDVFRIRALWLIFPMMAVAYAPAAGLRGLWAGPYSADVFGAESGLIGQVTLIMALSMVAGSFAYGPLDRLLGTRKWLIFGGNVLGAIACFLLFALPDQNIWLSAALLAGVGFFGASFPVIIAHGRSFIPAHLTGRGVTLLNLFSIGGVGVVQFVTGRLHSSVSANSDVASAPYEALFLFFGVITVVGLVIYAFSRDRTD